MNKNPLFIKSSLLCKIPFIRGKTARLYRRYLSEHKFIKIFENNPSLAETVSAYTLNSQDKPKDSYLGNDGKPQEFNLDLVNVEPSKFFSEEEWVSLGMLLRAYDEVENIKLMHLYNCLYSGEGNKVKGFVVIGRLYTLYSSTQLPVKITIEDTLSGIKSVNKVKYLSKNSPFIISPQLEYIDGEEELRKFEEERLVSITLEFTGNHYQPCTLVEGVYPGLSLSRLSGGEPKPKPVPEGLDVGHYSDKLVEFFAGTLITPLSDSKLISITEGKLISSGETVWEKIKNSTKGLYNLDGYLDKRSKI